MILHLSHRMMLFVSHLRPTVSTPVGTLAAWQKKFEREERNFGRISSLNIQQGIACVVHKIRRRGNDLAPDAHIANTNSQNEFGFGPSELRGCFSRLSCYL